LVLPDHPVSPLMNRSVALRVPSVNPFVSAAVSASGERPNRLSRFEILRLHLLPSEREERMIWCSPNYQARVEGDLQDLGVLPSLVRSTHPPDNRQLRFRVP